MPRKFKKTLNLREPCNVYIDWANVHGWTKSLKQEVDPKKLFRYLKSYKEIQDINFYFGKDKHPKSKVFLKDIKKIGYNVKTKPVKYIKLDFSVKTETDLSNSVKVLTPAYTRKCDFDMETCIDVHKDFKKGIKGFIFFTGDGDFAPLYKLLVQKKKQVIVIYASGHLGKEIWEIKKGLFKIQINNLLR